METQNEKPTFYGEPVSDYGIEQGFVDYATFAKCFDGVICNDIVKLFQTFDFQRIDAIAMGGEDAIMQWCIVDDMGANLLQKWLPDEILYYCEELDLTLWGITHYGTRWDYVLTPIKIVKTEYGFGFEKPQLSDDGGDDE